MIADFDGDIKELFKDHPEGEIPILATRNLMMFPGVVSPILVGRETSKKLIKAVGSKKKGNQIFAVFCQKDMEQESPTANDLYEYGVYGKLIKVLEFPGGGGNSTAIIQGLGRCRLDDITKRRPYLKGHASQASETMADEDDKEYATAVEDLQKKSIQFIMGNDDIPDEASFAMKNISNRYLLTNVICATLPFSIEEKAELIYMDSIKDRVFAMLKIINRELQLLELKQNIRSKTREDLDEQQREYFLKQQIKNIKEELGNEDGQPERKELLDKAQKKAWNDDVEKVFKKELDKLDLLNPQSPEYSVQLTYLQTLVSLPWNEYTIDDLDLNRARKVLDTDHYGMEKVKERILEYIAVLSLRGDFKSPILCLYGPPGVGKTSLGKSIAKAMGRKYVRVSLGGLHDESEIRGDRKSVV